MSLLDGAKRLLKLNRGLRGKRVTLIIGGVERADVLAQQTKCMVRVQAEGSTGLPPVQLVTDGRDWLIEASEYYVATDEDEEPVLVEPASGHQVRDAQGKTFEVLPLGMNEECFYYRDTECTELRVHSKRVRS